MSEYGNEQNGLVYASNPDVPVNTVNAMNVYAGDRYDFGRSDSEVLTEMAENYFDLAEESEDTRDVIAENEEMMVVEEDAPFKMIDLNDSSIAEDNTKGDIIHMPEIAFNNLIRNMVDKYENEDYKEEDRNYAPSTFATETFDDMAETVVDDVNKDLAAAMDEANHEVGPVIDDNEVEAKVPDFDY
jgi:hypothetical protein